MEKSNFSRFSRRIGKVGLDSIAKSRQTSRVSVIRRFLRHQIDEELKSLTEYLESSKQCNRTHRLLQQQIKDKEW